MKSTAVLALVAAGVVGGAGVATYELTRPASGSVQVNFVDPAAETSTTSEPTTTPTPTTTTATAVTSTQTTVTTATVTKEATVSEPSTSETSSEPVASVHDGPQTPGTNPKPRQPGPGNPINDSTPAPSD